MTDEPQVRFHLLGRIGLSECNRLQRRLVYEAGGCQRGQIVVLLCEHSPTITVGRQGSRADIHFTNQQLRLRGVQVQWTGRGGGCVYHAPGQLAIYPIVPLQWHDWSVGQFLTRLQSAVRGMLDALNIHYSMSPDSWGLWGRSGLLAAFGIAVRDWVTCQGVFLNVNPPMNHFARVDSVPAAVTPADCKRTMGCLLSERRHGVRMTAVRSLLIDQLANSFGCERHHLLTGHPLLPPLSSQRESSRAS